MIGNEIAPSSFQLTEVRQCHFPTWRPMIAPCDGAPTEGFSTCGEPPHGRLSWTVSISRLAVARRGDDATRGSSRFRQYLKNPRHTGRDGLLPRLHPYLSELFVVEGLR